MRIGEAETLTGLSAGTIRYWEERGLLSFDRALNSYRDIPDDTVELLQKIKLLRELGIAIADIKLWHDGLVSEHELLVSRRKQLEDDSRSNLDQRQLCEKLLCGSEVGELRFFSEVQERHGKLALGVDIGTTSISAKLISLETGKALHTYTLDHNAALIPDDSDTAHAIDAFAADSEKLLGLSMKLINAAVESFPELVSIGITGQMHGIICVGDSLSPLYTWQNQFGKRLIGVESVCDRIRRLSGYEIPTGYGLVTYYALKELGCLPDCNYITTIADLVTARLCGIEKPFCHPTNAASLGFFDIKKNAFDTAALEKLGIDSSVLPGIADDLAPLGKYRGISVSAAIGDNQAAVFGSLSAKGDVLVNIGTSGQVSFIGEGIANDDPSCEVRPFFDGKYLCSGSTLCGGRAYAMLADLVGEILEGFGVNRPRAEIYSFLNESAKASTGKLNVRTTFSGTRKEPSMTGSIEGITTADLKVGELTDGFFRGMVSELRELYDSMTDEPPERLIVSGNSMRKNSGLRCAAEKLFGKPTFIPVQTEEAAFGAALYGAISAGIINIETAKKLINYKGELS